MSPKLVHVETAQEIPEGSILHGCAGIAKGQAWRFENVREAPSGESPGLVHVSRSSKIGRDHRHFPPHVFNTKIVELDVSIKAHFEASAKQVWQGFVTLVVAGIVAFIVAVGMQHMFHV
jgi:hypothetical protein